MTLAEITRRRVELNAQLDKPKPKTENELPEYALVYIRQGNDRTEVGGTVYQQCGGGRRILRKKIGS